MSASEPPAYIPVHEPVSLRARKWLLLLAALLVVGAASVFFTQQRTTVKRAAPSASAVAHAARYDLLTSLRLASWSTLGWSPDRQTVAGLSVPVALGAPTGRLQLWNMLTSRTVSEVASLSDIGVLWSPDGGTLASTSYTATINLVDTTSGKLARTLTVPVPAEMPAKSPRNRPFVRVSTSSFLVGWAAGGRYLVSMASTGADDLLPSDTGVGAASFVSYVTVQVWEVAGGKLARNFVVADDPSATRIVQVRLSPTGKTLAIASYDISKSTGGHSANVRLWDVESGHSLTGPPPMQVAGSMPGAPVPLYIEWSPDSRTLAVANGPAIRLLEPGKTQYSRILAGSATPTAVPFSAASTAVPTNPALAPVPVSTGVAVSFPLPISTAGLMPGAGPIISSGPIAPPAQPGPQFPVLPNIFPMPPQGPPLPVPTPTLDPADFGSVQILAWSPAGDLLASYDGRSVRLWDVAGAAVRSIIDLGQNGSTGNFAFNQAGGRYGPIAWSPDGGLLATLNGDGWSGPPSVHLWDPATGVEVRQLGRGAMQIEWSAYADVLAVSYAGNPGKLELWGVRNSITSK